MHLVFTVAKRWCLIEVVKNPSELVPVKRWHPTIEAFQNFEVVPKADERGTAKHRRFSVNWR